MASTFSSHSHQALNSLGYFWAMQTQESIVGCNCMDSLTLMLYFYLIFFGQAWVSVNRRWCSSVGSQGFGDCNGALSASGSDDLGPCLIHVSSRTLACLISAPHKPTELLCRFLPLVPLASWSHPWIAWPGTRVTSFQILNALGCLKRKQESLLCLLAHVPSLLWAYTSSV